jgi:hypothetical protein
VTGRKAKIVVLEALRLGNTFLKKHSPHNAAAKADHDADTGEPGLGRR